jgi:metallo-beta-lactamase family protein
MSRSKGHRDPAHSVLEFLGATETVTGSRFLVSTAKARILVDCGLYQGHKVLRERNWNPIPTPPESIDSVLLTHAHVDHSGFLPRLVNEGFKGRVYATRRATELSQIILPDCGYRQEEEARFINAAGYSRHTPALHSTPKKM